MHGAREPSRTIAASRADQSSVVTQLRRLVPRRTLTFAEGVRVAELQATRLLELTGCPSGPVPETIISELPRIEVQRSARLAGSGLTTWRRDRWRVRLQAREPVVRQRFTLAHEFKHILDAAHEDVIYRHLPDGPQRRTHVEALCDAFAAALLMPRQWVHAQWSQGWHDPFDLAWHFQVSYQAMHIRLQIIGLTERQHRCRNAYEVGRTAVRGSRRRRPATFHRLALPTQRPLTVYPSSLSFGAAR